jgi:histidinol-phosphate aminotransferase
MEDAPLKPFPEPVMLAIEELDVSQAWMIGDTPDDMTAARMAGVLPIGVVAPMDELSRSTDGMFNEGAAMVLTKLSDIEEIIP